MSCFNYADDTSILCKHRDDDSAYNDLSSAASTMILLYRTRRNTDLIVDVHLFTQILW